MLAIVLQSYLRKNTNDLFWVQQIDAQVGQELMQLFFNRKFRWQHGIKGVEREKE